MKKTNSLFKINKNGFIKPFMFKCAPAFDITFALTVVFLALFGTLMVFSAGRAYAYARYDDGAYFIKRQFTPSL